MPLRGMIAYLGWDLHYVLNRRHAFFDAPDWHHGASKDVGNLRRLTPDGDSEGHLYQYMRCRLWLFGLCRFRSVVSRERSAGLPSDCCRRG